MKGLKPSARIAVLVDADNVSHVHLEAVLRELASHGRASIRRTYGDWTSERLQGWKRIANELSVQPVQQFAYTTGKNATDSALIIDAMDLLHQNDLDAFAIVSSDSDFTRLASRIRESGAVVFGFGARKTPKAFVNACDSFTYFDVLPVSVDGPATGPSRADEPADPVIEAESHPPMPSTSAQLRGDTRLVNLLRSAISAGADDDGWTHLGAVGSTVQMQSPDFDSRNWGYAKLGDMVEAVGLFDVDRFVEPSGHTNLRVRIRTKN